MHPKFRTRSQIKYDHRAMQFCRACVLEQWNGWFWVTLSFRRIK